MKIWLDYDAEADVLYMRFVERPASTHSELQEDGVILDYPGAPTFPGAVATRPASHPTGFSQNPRAQIIADGKSV
jgi:hypothetical protein